MEVLRRRIKDASRGRTHVAFVNLPSGIRLLKKEPYPDASLCSVGIE